MLADQQIDSWITKIRNVSDDESSRYKTHQLQLIEIYLLKDIRDLLIEIRDQEHVVSFVPPDYGKENQL